MLPVPPKLAVSWPSGFREEPMLDLRRRQFLMLLSGGAAVAWPLAAGAQQPKIPVIGFLRPTPAAGFEYILNAFRQGLNEAGFVEGKTSPSSIAGRTISQIGYRDWRPISFAGSWPRSLGRALGRRMQPKPQPRRRRSYSSWEPILSELAWSQASTDRAPTSRASSLSLLPWRPSCSD